MIMSVYNVVTMWAQRELPVRTARIRYDTLRQWRWLTAERERGDSIILAGKILDTAQLYDERHIVTELRTTLQRSGRGLSLSLSLPLSLSLCAAAVAGRHTYRPIQRQLHTLLVHVTGKAADE